MREKFFRVNKSSLFLTPFLSRRKPLVFVGYSLCHLPRKAYLLNQILNRQGDTKREVKSLGRKGSELETKASRLGQSQELTPEVSETMKKNFTVPSMADLGASNTKKHLSNPDNKHAVASKRDPIDATGVAVGLERSQDLKKEAKKLAEMRLMDQETEDARECVKLQREIKKKNNAMRKVQKKLKGMSCEDSEFCQTKEEEAQLHQEIASIEALLQGESNELSKVCPSVAVTEAPSSEKVASPNTTAPNTDKLQKAETREQVEEGSYIKLQELVKHAMQLNNYPQKRHLVPPQYVVHPCVAEVALMIEEMLIVGGNARTMATIYAFGEILKSTPLLACPSLKDINTTLFEKLVNENFSFLRRKREASIGMHYVKKALLRRIVAARDKGDQLGDPRELALQLLASLEAELCMSIKTIVEDRSLPYVSNQDTILVFGRSSVVEFILLSRVQDPQRCPKRVIVVDSGPLFEGRTLAHKLSDSGIQVTYGLITACCTLMPKCTRVFIGASSVLQSGDVFTRCGTALVSACAKAFRKPVLCFAESYKFAAEVWIGNLAQNTKLVDIREHASFNSSGMRSPIICSVSASPLFTNSSQYRITEDFDSLKPIQAMDYGSSSASGYLYDLTPATYVDMIVCEMGCLHTSAIIAVIKDREGLEATPLM